MSSQIMVDARVKNISTNSRPYFSALPLPNATVSDARRRMVAPLIIPHSQVYYWTRAWQQGESESLADLRTGRARRFHSAADAAAYLLSDDE